MIEEGSLQEFIHGCKYELMEDFMLWSDEKRQHDLQSHHQWRKDDTWNRWDCIEQSQKLLLS